MFLNKRRRKSSDNSILQNDFTVVVGFLFVICFLEDNLTDQNLKKIFFFIKILDDNLTDQNSN